MYDNISTRENIFCCLVAWHKFMRGKTFPHAAFAAFAASDSESESASWHAGKSAAAAGNIQSMRHVAPTSRIRLLAHC